MASGYAARTEEVPVTSQHAQDTYGQAQVCSKGR